MGEALVSPAEPAHRLSTLTPPESTRRLINNRIGRRQARRSASAVVRRAQTAGLKVDFVDIMSNEITIVGSMGYPERIFEVTKDIIANWERYAVIVGHTIRSDNVRRGPSERPSTPRRRPKKGRPSPSTERSPRWRGDFETDSEYQEGAGLGRTSSSAREVEPLLVPWRFPHLQFVPLD